MDFRISRCALRYLHIDRTVCHDPLPGGLLQRPGQHCNGNRFYLSRPLLRALVNRDVVAPRRPNVELTRTADLLTWILDHFLPLRDPAGGARHREKHGEHGHRKAYRFQDDPSIEIDIRIKSPVDEKGPPSLIQPKSATADLRPIVARLPR